MKKFKDTIETLIVIVGVIIIMFCLAMTEYLVTPTTFFAIIILGLAVLLGILLLVSVLFR